MPRGDKTGPNGAGQLSGRRMGYCSGNDRPGYMEGGYGRGFNRGFGRGRGTGRGIGRGFGQGIRYAEPDYAGAKSDDISIKEEISSLKDILSSILKKLSKND